MKGIGYILLAIAMPFAIYGYYLLLGQLELLVYIALPAICMSLALVGLGLSQK